MAWTSCIEVRDAVGNCGDAAARAAQRMAIPGSAVCSLGFAPTLILPPSSCITGDSHPKMALHRPAKTTGRPLTKDTGKPVPNSGARPPHRLTIFKPSGCSANLPNTPAHTHTAPAPVMYSMSTSSRTTPEPRSRAASPLPSSPSYTSHKLHKDRYWLSVDQSYDPLAEYEDFYVPPALPSISTESDQSIEEPEL